MRFKPQLAPMVWQFREDVLSRMAASCAPLPAPPSQTAAASDGQDRPAALSSVSTSTSSTDSTDSDPNPHAWLPKTLTIFSREVRTQMDMATTNKVKRAYPAGHLPKLSAGASHAKLRALVDAASQAGWAVTVVPPRPTEFVEEQLRAVQNATVVVGEEGAAWGSIGVLCPNRGMIMLQVQYCMYSNACNFTSYFYYADAPAIRSTPIRQLPTIKFEYL